MGFLDVCRAFPISFLLERNSIITNCFIINAFDMRRLNLGEVCHGRLCCVAQVSELYEIVFPILISVVPRSNLSTKSERELLIVWTATCTRQHRGNILRCQGVLQVVLRGTYYVLAAGVDLFHEEIRVGVRDVLVGANV